MTQHITDKIREASIYLREKYGFELNEVMLSKVDYKNLLKECLIKAPHVTPYCQKNGFKHLLFCGVVCVEDVEERLINLHTPENMGNLGKELADGQREAMADSLIEALGGVSKPYGSPDCFGQSCSDCGDCGEGCGKCKEVCKDCMYQKKCGKGIEILKPIPVAPNPAIEQKLNEIGKIALNVEKSIESVSVCPLPISHTDPDYVPPALESLTCFGCAGREGCEYVDDAYNTNGDCLANK